VWGVCWGSRREEDTLDAERLSSLDRHEVAHCVLTSHCFADFDPPAVLTEGWAEANSGRGAAEVAARAWERWRRGDDPSLGELTGPDWYDRHEGPAFGQGGALGTFILERLGPGPFLRAYRTCPPPAYAPGFP